jgi:membrane protease YdiL (CAAX protease family)
MFYLYQFFSGIPIVSVENSNGNELTIERSVSVLIIVLFGVIGFCFFGSRTNLVQWKVVYLWRYKVLNVCAVFAIVFFQKISFYLLNILNIPIITSVNEARINQLSEKIPLFLMLFLVSILAPVCEELIFRAGIFKWVFPKNRLIAWVVSTVIFAYAHMMSDVTNWFAWFIYIGTGGILGIVYYRTNKLECSMFVHSLFNLFQVFIPITQC